MPTVCHCDWALPPPGGRKPAHGLFMHRHTFASQHSIAQLSSSTACTATSGLHPAQDPAAHPWPLPPATWLPLAPPPARSHRHARQRGHGRPLHIHLATRSPELTPTPHRIPPSVSAHTHTHALPRARAGNTLPRSHISASSWRSRPALAPASTLPAPAANTRAKAAVR